MLGLSLLPGSAAEMWERYTKNPPLHHQQRITEALEKHTLASLRNDVHLPPVDRARLISVGKPSPSSKSISIAGHWLTTLPTRPEYTLTDTEFRLAARHRLGLKPIDDMPHAICMCDKGNFNEDAQHFHSCSSLKRLPVLVRHNYVANVVATIASNTHMNVAHEFIGRQLIADMQRNSGAHDHEIAQADSDDQYGVPDLVITGAGFGAFVDVAISYPGAPSYVQRATNEYAAIASARALQKHAKYDNLCSAKGLQMVPFCLESFGHGVLHGSGEASAFLTTLAMNADPAADVSIATRGSLLLHALTSLSFALQRGNAQISISGLSLLRLRVVRMSNRRVAL